MANACTKEGQTIVVASTAWMPSYSRSISAERDVWLETEVWQKVNLYMANARGFVALIFELIDVLEPAVMVNVAMIFWTLVEAQSEVQIEKNNRSNTGNGVQENSWTKPPRGSLKCNIDIVACHVEQNIYCVGACIHDEHGHFVQAFVKRCDGKQEIAEAEAIGMLEVLKWLYTSYVMKDQLVMKLIAYESSKPLKSSPSTTQSMVALLHFVIA
ncbi:replication protein A 70 kDa dna-binding subunit [Trifolium medium]|uniref:Replication protein A 70 kDa dna-binding subunit n=1 Tax=Trifolium medium TaxID=97028 RepID=A0A392LYV9_9FABA|nr:replication protein A 70 kDa dna-binding subunit [Trifolium medium]